MAPGDRPLADGTIPGLWLHPGNVKGNGKWVFRFVSPTETSLRKKSGEILRMRRDMGLGTYPEVSIAAARIRGMAARQLIQNGKDPIEERNRERTAVRATAEAMTFERAARQVHAEQKPGWKNPKHADQWIKTLNDYIFPHIGNRKVADLVPADFAEALRPVWLKKAETASRVKQRCHSVMKWCWAHGLVKANPVDVVDHLLPIQPSKRVRVRHHPYLPWREVPSFVTSVLRAQPPNATRRLLEFVILTAARSGEARAMTWDEVDLDAKIWTVPASRMKAKVPHQVPLSNRAVEILKAQREEYPDTNLIFPSPRGKVLSDMALTSFLRDQKVASSDPKRVATAHGFRSSFRNWASDNRHDRELAERALAHTIQNQTEAAYLHTDLLEQRRPMMESWADFVCGSNS